MLSTTFHTNLASKEAPAPNETSSEAASPRKLLHRPRVPEIPQELWEKVLGFTDRTLGIEARAMNRFQDARGFIEADWRSRLSHIPNLKHIMEGMDPKGPLPLQTLIRRVKIAQSVQKILTGVRHFNRSFDRDAHQLKTFIEQKAASILSSAPDANDSIRKLASRIDSITWQTFFITAVLLEDKNPLTNFDLSVIDPETVDFAAFLFLHQGRVDLFEKTLEFTSLCSNDTNLQWRSDVLNTLLVLAAEKEQKDIFQKLIALNKHQSRAYNASAALVALSENDRFADAISLLLKADAPINDLYDPTLRYPGIHKALAKAAEKNQMQALKAILAALPDAQIDQQILRDVLEKAPNDSIRSVLEHEIALRYLQNQ